MPSNFNFLTALKVLAAGDFAQGHDRNQEFEPPYASSNMAMIRRLVIHAPLCLPA